MIAEIVVGAAVGTIVVIKVRTARRLDRIAKNLMIVRAQTLEPFDYRPLDAGANLDELAEPTEQLRAAGMTVLGELMSAGEQPVPTRWFADAAGTSFGPVAVARGIAVAQLMSRAGERVFATRLSRTPQLATPPFAARKVLRPPAGLTEMVGGHRQLLVGVEGLVRATSLEEAWGEYNQMRERVLAWRDSLPHEELLDRDLRAMLGANYGVLGTEMKRRLAAKFPVAKAL